MEVTNNSITAARSSVTTYDNLIKKPAISPMSSDKMSNRSELQNESINTTGKDQVTLDSNPIPSTTSDTIKSLQRLQKKSNDLAQDIRATNKNVGNVTDLVSQMQSSLSSITKNFPPFDIESKDRQKILMSYISIRKELIKMSVPPPTAPIYEQVSNKWGAVISKDGSITPDSVPALQTNSSDSEVAQAEKSLNNTQGKLAGITAAVINFRPVS